MRFFNIFSRRVFNAFSRRALPVFLCAALASCAGGAAARKNERPLQDGNARQNERPRRSPPLSAASGNATVTIVAAGDNLIHIEIINDAKTANGYNFNAIYTGIKPLIQSADIAFINQETLIAGEKFTLSGYPEFNGPAEISRALADTGFDVVNHATNHAMDKGGAAVNAVLDVWDKYPQVLVLGIHRSAESRSARPAIIEKKNIKIGWLSYTYGTNGIALPKDKPFLVSLIDTQVMAREIDALRPLCDFLIVSMHWGEEYQHAPSKRQRELAVFLAGHKVDLVLGHHPHVIQPAEEIIQEDGKRTLVFFSLGNFLSCQKEKARLLGAVARVSITKTSNVIAPSEVKIINAEIIPVVTHYESGYVKFKVYPLSEYTEALFEKHGIQTIEKVPFQYFSTLHRSVFSVFNRLTGSVK